METIPVIKRIKNTITKKYVLGRHRNKRSVGVLIKNKDTIKNIIKSHKDLKTAPIHEVKKYLRKRGLIKSDTSCPEECLRKLYESSVLTGDVKNTNEAVALHNMIKGMGDDDAEK
jgi:hypothetical protein